MSASVAESSPKWIERRRCAAPGPSLAAPGSGLVEAPPGAPAPSQAQRRTDLSGLSQPRRSRYQRPRCTSSTRLLRHRRGPHRVRDSGRPTAIAPIGVTSCTQRCLVVVHERIQQPTVTRPAFSRLDNRIAATASIGPYADTDTTED